MAKREFYEVLGVGRDADDKTIKSAYRKLAMANHPDRNPDDDAAAERFREASEAYEVLKDSQKRAAYDQLVTPHLNNQPVLAGPGPGLDSAAVSDIFEQMFSEFSGGRGGGGQSRHGADLRYDLDIDLDGPLPLYQDIVAEISASVRMFRYGCRRAAGQRPVLVVAGGQGPGPAGFSRLSAPVRPVRVGRDIDPCRSCRGQGRVEKAENRL